MLGMKKFSEKSIELTKSKEIDFNILRYFTFVTLDLSSSSVLMSDRHLAKHHIRDWHMILNSRFEARFASWTNRTKSESFKLSTIIIGRRQSKGYKKERKKPSPCQKLYKVLSNIVLFFTNSCESIITPFYRGGDSGPRNVPAGEQQKPNQSTSVSPFYGLHNSRGQIIMFLDNLVLLIEFLDEKNKSTDTQSPALGYLAVGDS